MTSLAKIINGKLIEKHRKPSELADDSGISRAHICEWLNGVLVKDPKEEQLKKIASVEWLKMSYEDLYSHSTRNSSLSKTKGTLLINEVRWANEEHIDTLKHFLSKAGGGLSDAQWKEIRKIVGE